MNSYYLAYGMNTNLDNMTKRCPKAISLGTVTLADHKLAFKSHCDALVAPGHSMECALWRITPACERSLDALEGFPDYYGKKEVKVTHNGREIRAMIYYMNNRDELFMPSEGYLNMVVEGYSQHGMPIAQVIKALEDLTVCTSL